MKKMVLLSSAALGALFLAGSNAFAADINIPQPPIDVVEVEEASSHSITIGASLAWQDGDWEVETEAEIEFAMRNGVGVRLNIFDNIELPVEHSPGVRATIFKEFGDFEVGFFAGVFGDDLPLPGFTGDWLWEVGFNLGASFGPVDIETELRREQQFGGGAAYFADAEATIHLSDMFALIAGVAVEFDSPIEVTGHVAVEIALGRVTVTPSFAHRFYGPTFRNTVALEVAFQATDRLAIMGGVERINNVGTSGVQPITVWGGFEFTFGD